jgi:hypothetical protein
MGILISTGTLQFSVAEKCCEARQPLSHEKWPLYFFRFFFSEDIIWLASLILPNHQRIIIYSEKNAYFFLKK